MSGRKFIRTCQECGFKQEDNKPEGEPTPNYSNRKCRRCKSMSLDYGSYVKE